MARQRYIEKSTGEIWTIRGGGGDITRLVRYDDWDKKDPEMVEVTDKELSERFEFKPWPDPVIKTDEVKHPIRITLRCPECGNVLKPYGGAYLTHPLQYEHKCSNPDCKYETCTRSYYSGMCTIVTDEQEAKLLNGTYNEDADGALIKISERNLWRT